MAEANQKIERISRPAAENEPAENEPEMKVKPEKKPDKKQEQAGRIVEKYLSATLSGTPAGDVPAAGGAVSVKEIEQVLSGDLEDIYFQLPPDIQQKFKREGEAAARKIKGLLDRAKVNAKKIARLIMDWLKIIPGINKFFLEQEGKIKTDEVLKLKSKPKNN
ncbi:hypothetical protein COT99_02250 [Candidatus Falkowbacteria bacterium CG10_big_fil_rev_8_21_14_0_10_43_10]|uniref:Uncharacterized protein n=1 Tax=Candidatus Falkowbacteria bacterium CG10_big_fil_rev_8_21_14_0_10_43_10 TaxID=1974567 RepID=A0A2H0V283_9BACT|nr:MAG: hypothetical protein COT99_02250 [Candidatus Falkowbacteria bacterium CG10_big_fil_rev_8_21_14_0_10_43_10]